MKKIILLSGLLLFLTSCASNSDLKQESYMSNIEKEKKNISTKDSQKKVEEEASFSSEEDNTIIELFDETENYDRFLLFMDNLKLEKDDNIKIISYTMEGDQLIRTLDYRDGIIFSKYDTTMDEYGGKEVIENTFNKVIEKDGVYILKNEVSVDEENSILVKR